MKKSMLLQHVLTCKKIIRLTAGLLFSARSPSGHGRHSLSAPNSRTPGETR